MKTIKSYIFFKPHIMNCVCLNLMRNIQSCFRRNVQLFRNKTFFYDFWGRLLRIRITIKPTLVGNKCQTIKARVHANIYLRENNNNSGANPPFGTTPVQRKEREEGRKGVLRDVGNTTSKRKRERKEEGESSPSMFNACSFTYIRAHVFVWF